MTDINASTRQATSSGEEINIVWLLPCAIEEAVVVVRRSSSIDGIICIDTKMDSDLQPEGIKGLLVSLRQRWQKALVVVARHENFGHVRVRRDVRGSPHADAGPHTEDTEQWKLEGLDLRFAFAVCSSGLLFL